jgi:hypothetical protein
MAFNASPGLETFERSNFGLASVVCRALVVRLPPLK